MTLAPALEAFFAEQGFAAVEELKPGIAYVVDGGPRNQRVVIVIDPIDPERRPGKPKGKARGEAMLALTRMEEVFMVMKDYRFFKLCLPGVFGMGRYGEAFDWVMLKHYEGTRYDEARGDVPLDVASDAAMMIFDLSQVPVLKFSKHVATEHYPNRLEELHPQLSLLVDHGIASAERVETLVTEWRVFFEQKVPTIYAIQNGDFRPKKFLQLAESVVLLDWAGALITTIEDVVAYGWLAMYRQPEWQKHFLEEVGYLVDLHPQWLQVMQQWWAARRAIAALQAGTLNDAEREAIQSILHA